MLYNYYSQAMDSFPGMAVQELYKGNYSGSTVKGRLNETTGMSSSGSQRLKKYLNQYHDSYYDKSWKTCNETVLSLAPPTDGVYCPALLDDWGICINYTQAGTTAYLPCPGLSIFNPSALSFRKCEKDGTWQIVTNGKSWTNTTACSQNMSFQVDISNSESVSYLYLFIAGSSLSLLLLAISLLIFYGFRQLRCDRITIHKNLFFSYVFAALTWILYYRLVVFDGLVIVKNPVWCQALHVVAQYFAATNFSWMFCEGLYLHIIMAHALRTGKKLIKCHIVGGWGVPLILTSLYAAVRGAVSQDAHSCWIQESSHQWIIAAPIVASLVINICILINLVRLLMTKLKQIPNANENRQAAKAILILVPLFGLQFLVFPVKPDNDSVFYPFYLYFMASLVSLQGSVVSIIFCFCNGEVRSLIRRKWNQHRLMNGSTRKNNGTSSSTVVDGYSVIDSAREASCLRTKITHDAQHRPIEEIEFKAIPIATTPLVEKDNSRETNMPV